MKPTCERCPERATLHVTEISDEGEVGEIHLCQKCASKYLQEAEEAPAATAGAMGTAVSPVDANAPTLQCPLCKTTFADFRSTGRLGCPHDYEVFGKELRTLLENIHSGVRHVGKVPKRLPPDTRLQTQLIKLRQELQQTIAVEDYEKAAKLRDEIEQLERQS